MEVIDTLIDLFQQFKKLCEKAFPLWKEFLQEAEKQLKAQQEKEAREKAEEDRRKAEACARASGLSPARGDISTTTSRSSSKTSEQKSRISKLLAELETQRKIENLAWEKYLQSDPNDIKTLSQLEKKMADVAKQIDQTLLSYWKTIFLKYGRTKDTLLVEDWSQRRYSISLKWVLQRQADGSLTRTIDTLEYIKADINLQKQLIEVKSQQDQQRRPEETKEDLTRNTPPTEKPEETRQVKMRLNESERFLVPSDYLVEVSREISKFIVSYPANKNKFCKHIEKVIQKAEKYGKYLRVEWQRAKELGLTKFDENKDKEKWFWWTAYKNDWMMDDCVYFANDECSDVQFYIEGKPKPDLLGYLSSMVWGCVGQEYEGLELLDYQFVLLAIIHDSQNWQAGRERIYFSPLGKKALSDRLCRAVWHRLKNYKDPYKFKDIQDTIDTALRAVTVELDAETEHEFKPAKEPKGKKQGRPRVYTDDQLRRMLNAYEQFYQETNDSKAAWSKVAEFYSVKTGNAARVACQRLQKST